MFSLSSPITGAAQTGFTSPTYTLTTDTATLGAAKSFVVSALGGTQAGVTSHSIARPFSIHWIPPKQLAALPAPDANGFIRAVPRNNHMMLVRCGVLPLAGQPNQIALLRIRFEIPAGSDTADAAQLRAMCSAAIGALSQISAGIGDTMINGVV